MGTFRGHENSRNLKFNETQWVKRLGNKRNELNEDEPAKVEQNEIDKRKKISDFAEHFFFCVTVKLRHMFTSFT